jgi:sulfite oxidase
MPNRPLSLHEATHEPYNAETPLPALLEEVTPVDLVYVRNHFEVPQVNPTNWTLEVRGAVRRPLSISLRDIQALPPKTLPVTLECAGNGRASMNPVPEGTPWTHGAVSAVRVAGTPVRSVLEKAGLAEKAVEVLFLGADRGEVAPGRVEQFARTLPLEVAMDADTLLVWEMNGRPLTLNHGFPLRLIVPGWYAMASIKWLKDIRVLNEPYQGFFQSEHYVYLDEEGTQQGEPVRRMRVRSLITRPAFGSTLKRGKIEVLGLAWSGHGTVTEVELSTDGGNQWVAAVLDTPDSSYGVQRWRYLWRPETEGMYTLVCRATDSLGNTQPTAQRWNSLGYGNNGPHTVALHVV